MGLEHGPEMGLEHGLEMGLEHGLEHAHERLEHAHEWRLTMRSYASIYEFPCV